MTTPGKTFIDQVRKALKEFSPEAFEEIAAGRKETARVREATSLYMQTIKILTLAFERSGEVDADEVVMTLVGAGFTAALRNKRTETFYAIVEETKHV